VAPDHVPVTTTMGYYNSRELHQADEKPQVARSRRGGIEFCAFRWRLSDQARLWSDPL
jgi:hypothetical protein